MNNQMRGVIAVSMIFFFAGCHHRPGAEMEPAMQQCMAEKQAALKQTADMCAQRLASIQETRQEVDAAQSAKTLKQTKAALAKASTELQQSEENISIGCEHVNLMSTMPHNCMMMHHECHKGCKCGMMEPGPAH